MFLPTAGVNRDRTADFISLKGIDREVHSDKREADSARLLTEDMQPSSILEPFFQLAIDVKSEIKRAHVALSELLKAQQQCLRPTFTDGSDQYQDVVTMTSSLNARIKDIQRKVDYIVLKAGSNPDRAKILQNLRASLSDALRHLATEFKMAQQTFNASYTRQPQTEDVVESGIDFSTLNFGERHQEALVQSEDEEIEQLVRRAAEVREIFADLAQLIVEQGTVIDRIDYNIAQSLENAEEAHRQITKAAKKQQKSRMWKFAAVLAVFVAILLIIVVTK